MADRRLLPPALLVAALALAGCGGDASGGTRTPTPPDTRTATAADRDFVRHMLVHHRRAITVGRLAQERGRDPRVRGFGATIVRQQTPEERRLTSWAAALGITPRPADAAMADGYVDDAALRRLRALAPRTFDREVLLASARSEAGAARMAAIELRSGRYAPARELARAIATAPTGQIPQLRALAGELPR
jgi:uncharacterized protein (DUF305 family)